MARAVSRHPPRGCPRRAIGPEARYEQTEAISLAFVMPCRSCRRASAPCSSCATYAAFAPTRWRTCSTRASSRSTVPSNGQARRRGPRRTIGAAVVRGRADRATGPAGGGCGARRGELAALKVRDLEGRVLYICRNISGSRTATTPKSHQYRSLTPGRATVELSRAHVERWPPRARERALCFSGRSSVRTTIPSSDGSNSVITALSSWSGPAAHSRDLGPQPVECRRRHPAGDHLSVGAWPLGGDPRQHRRPQLVLGVPIRGRGHGGERVCDLQGPGHHPIVVDDLVSEPEAHCLRPGVQRGSQHDLVGVDPAPVPQHLEGAHRERHAHPLMAATIGTGAPKTVSNMSASAGRKRSPYSVPPSTTRRRSTPAENTAPVPVRTTAPAWPASSPTRAVTAATSSMSIAFTLPCARRSRWTGPSTSCSSIALLLEDEAPAVSLRDASGRAPCDARYRSARPEGSRECPVRPRPAAPLRTPPGRRPRRRRGRR